jgi:hypothetical protein
MNDSQETGCKQDSHQSVDMKRSTPMKEVKNIGWRVTFAGLGINLALGILYTWSIFKESIKESIMSQETGASTGTWLL